ncbi:hypothetical protein ACJX0J_040925, partial [Zea mays]
MEAIIMLKLSELLNNTGPFHMISTKEAQLKDAVRQRRRGQPIDLIYNLMSCSHYSVNTCFVKVNMTDMNSDEILEILELNPTFQVKDGEVGQQDDQVLGSPNASTTMEKELTAIFLYLIYYYEMNTLFF